MNDLEFYTFGFVLFSTILAGVFFVVFGQKTVKKLRKNPTTKESLGFEYVSGWDIINVAQALAMPDFIMKKLNNSPLSYLFSNAELIRKNTTRVDRILAGLFYWLLMTSGLSGFALVLLNALGVFK